MSEFLNYFWIFFFICAYASSSQLPANFKRCNSKDTPCLKDAIQDALGKMKNGIPELGVPSLDPLTISKMSVGAGTSVNLVQNYENVEVFGLSDFQIKELNFDLDNGKIVMDLYGPLAQLNATYTVKGKIMVLDVYGTGKNMISIEHVTGKMTVNIETFTKDGQKYIKATGGHFPIEAEHVVFRFDNLFDGNKQLGDNVNLVLNDNWKEIWEELRGGYIEKIIEYTNNLMNKIFEKVPISEMFIDK